MLSRERWTLANGKQAVMNCLECRRPLSGADIDVLEAVFSVLNQKRIRKFPQAKLVEALYTAAQILGDNPPKETARGRT